MINIYNYLDQHRIVYKRFDHPAIFSSREKHVCPPMPGAGIKNLFLYDKQSNRHFLVVVGHGKTVDLKTLKKMIGVANLSFGSEERLKNHLGVTPGSVTILGLVHDTTHAVEVIIDAALQGHALQCHPLINTATLVIPFSDVLTFIKTTGHQVTFIDLPSKNEESL